MWLAAVEAARLEVFVTMSSGALTGVRIVEFGGYVAGPLAGLLLADAGAEVVHVRRPGPSKLAVHADAVLQRSKTVVDIDLRDVDGVAVARSLVRGADVLIENFRPGVMNRLGLGPDWCTANNPWLVYCAIPGFGADDPRAAVRAYEPIVSAAASIYRPPRSRGPGGPEIGNAPSVIAAPLLSSYAAVIAAHSIVAALLVRARDGVGQRVESALYDAAFEIVGHEFQQHHLRAAGSGFTPPTWLGTAHYRCAGDRWIHLCLFDDRHLRWFGETFAPAWTTEGLFEGDRLRADPALQDELFTRLAGLLATRTAGEWEVAINEQGGAPAAICQTASDWLTIDAHARDSGAVVELTDPVLGATTQLGRAIDLDVTPLVPHARTFGPPPSWEPAPSRVPGPAPTPDRSALDGVHVVDFTQVLAGPTCARVLAEYGAVVIKVNKPTDRGIPWHAWINRGKQSILLDLGDPNATGIVDRLLSSADVICQNFTNGVADRLGIGESVARAKRADVIYTSISAFGRHGARAGWRGREELGQAVTGLQTSWATDDGEPAMNTFPVADIGTGHLAALGVLLALYHRQRTGQGQTVAASLAQTATLLQAPTMEHTGRCWDEPTGQHAKGWSPDNHLYEGSDGRWLYVVGAGHVGLDQATFATRPAVDWIDDLNARGHTAQLVTTADELVDDPIARQRGLSLGDNVGVMPRLSATPARAGRAAPPPGSDSRAVLAALDCLDEWDTLITAGVVIAPANTAHNLT